MGIIEVARKMPIGELFGLLDMDRKGEYHAPLSLHVETMNGFKKVEGLIKTQKNQEWEVITDSGRKGVFADFHRLECFSPDTEKFEWRFVKDLSEGDLVVAKGELEMVVSSRYLGVESEMYDLQVDGSSYLTNGFNSHNTGFLGNYAVNSFLSGKNVLVYSFETSRERLAMRYYSSLIHMSKKDMLLDEAAFKEKANDILSKMPGDLILKEYNSNTVCSNDLLAHVSDLNRYMSWKPDIIIIDYLLIMLTNDKRMSSENGFKYYKTVTEEVRNIGKTLNVPIITATQINREGMSDRGGSKSLVTSKNIAESRGIYDTVDFFGIITQTAKEKEKNKYYLYIDKNRNERTGVRIEYEVDYNYMTLEEKAMF